MRKAVRQGIITVLLFFGTWFVLSKIDWVGAFKVQKIADQTEQKLGELIWEVLKKENNENTHVLRSIDSIVAHICEANSIDVEKIKIHILNNDDINAFALPNGHLIVYSGLILNSDNQDEVIGVISHEIAHIELNHVMKKLVKEVGFSILVSMTTGIGASEAVRETVKLLSSTVFDRSLEKEADLKAVDYLTKASVNPIPLASFLFKLSDKEYKAEKYLTWISTHPNSKARAEYIIEHSKGNTAEYRSILADETWEKLKEELSKPLPSL